MNFGITLSNRGIPVGLCSARDLLALADAVEACPVMDSVWCGDALFVNRRLDALTLLAAVAGAPNGCCSAPPAWVRSRCAIRWSSPMNGPRSTCCRTAALASSSAPAAARVRCGRRRAPRSYIPPGERPKRVVENIQGLRHLWTKDNQPFAGQFTQFANVTLEPKPLQSPCPIWLATNAERLSQGQADSGGSELALRRVGTIADGWMTHSVSPGGFQRSWDFILKAGRESGRDMSAFDNVLYHHINVNAGKQEALVDSK